MVTRAIEDACREYRELIRPMGEAVGDIDAYLLGNVLSYLDIAMAIDDVVPDEYLGHGLYGRNWADAPSGSG